jgi:DNA repair exonuclease SbcCD ATPase subunit
MTEYKDRLGEQLKNKEKAEEDLYFAEQDRRALERLRAERAAGTRPAVDCPRCGAKLREEARHGVAVDVCPAGHGMWLDVGELKVLAEREHDYWLTRLIRAWE